ncbi:PKD domain-containing protein [Flavobacterium sp.]|uniref:PKD domain-containing protein n=1 Tax=Flavobacterium sp. TaxID=239 RepID=UPI0039E247E4
MKKMIFAATLGLVLCSCNADDELVQDAAQTGSSAAVADFKLTKPNALFLEGTQMELVNTSKNAKSYQWDFGDGTTSEEATPHHLFPKCGTYNVKLTVTDANGELASVEKPVDVFCTVPRHRANPMVYSTK